MLFTTDPFKALDRWGRCEGIPFGRNRYLWAHNGWELIVSLPPVAVGMALFVIALTVYILAGEAPQALTVAGCLFSGVGVLLGIVSLLIDTLFGYEVMQVATYFSVIDEAVLIYLKRNRMTQAALATEMEMSENTFSWKRRGVRDWSMSEAVRLYRILGIPLDEDTARSEEVLDKDEQAEVA